MKVRVTCPHGKIKDNRIACGKTGKLCGNVYWCDMAGRWLHNENAARCPLRKEQ